MLAWRLTQTPRHGLPLLPEGPSRSRKAQSPLEETHDQAEVEEGINSEEEAVPQACPSVEGVKVQIVVVTDAADHCRQQDGGGQSGPQARARDRHALSPPQPHRTVDVEGQRRSCQQHHQRLPGEQCVQEAPNALPGHGLLNI